MLVLGDREEADGTVSVRTRKGGDQGSRALADFVKQAQDEIAARSADL
jgi:threonyl-tRNA synthetase